MLLKKLLPILFVFFVGSGFSQNPKVIDTLKIHNQIKLFGLSERVLKFKSHFFSSIIFKNDSTLFYNPNGTFYLFEIHLGDEPKVYELAIDNHSELNFNRYLFTYNNILYSYGGEGRFSAFPWLIYFDFKTKKWVKKEIKNYPTNSKKVLISWKLKNKLTTVLNFYSEEKEEDVYSEKKEEYVIGEIDLEKFEYKETYNFKSIYRDLLFVSKLGFFRGNYIYDSELYSIHGYYQDNNEVDYRILNKRSGVLRGTSKLEDIKTINGLSYLYIKDSSIYYKNELGILDSFNVNEGNVYIEKKFISKYISNTNSNTIYYIIIMVIIVSFLLLIKKKKNSFNVLIPDQDVIEGKIKGFKSTIISKEKLDELFGISHYSYETIKKKRSLIIKEINKNGNIKIDRVRKLDDKRFYDYKIY